jgi:hypothetical protein
MKTVYIQLHEVVQKGSADLVVFKVVRNISP